MSSTFSYSGLTTKVRAMQGKLISDEEFIEIANLSSVPEVISYLQSHPGYSNLFPESVQDDFYHRENLEHILILSMYANFAKLYTFSSLKQRKYMQIYFMHYETRFLKQILRELFNGHSSSSNFDGLDIYYNHFSSIPVDDVIRASSIDELIDSLKTTKYYEPLKKVSLLPENTLFDYEISLDLFQFTTFWKKKDKYLSGTDLKVITDSVGYKIDLLNIQWIYRCKKYYNMTSADILSLIIPIHHKIKAGVLNDMINADSVNSFIDILRKTFYGKTLSDFNSITIEKYYNQLMNNYYKYVFRSNPYSLACINTYLHLQEHETEKIITVTECIRYSYAVDDILKILQIGGESHDR